MTSPFEDVFVNHEGFLFRRGRIPRETFALLYYADHYKRARVYVRFLLKNYWLRRGALPVPSAGLLAPAGDFERLGRAMAALAADHEGWAAMGTRAREHVGGPFSMSRLVHDIEALYDPLGDPHDRWSG
jgi:hypothetical protein